MPSWTRTAFGTPIAAYRHDADRKSSEYIQDRESFVQVLAYQVRVQFEAYPVAIITAKRHCVRSFGLLGDQYTFL